MIHQDSLLVTMVKLVDRIPMPPTPAKRGPGRPKFYPNRLFLKALVIMIVRHLHKVNELRTVLEQPGTRILLQPLLIFARPREGTACQEQQHGKARLSPAFSHPGRSRAGGGPIASGRPPQSAHRASGSPWSPCPG